MESAEENNQEKKIPVEKGSLGKPATRDPHAPLADFNLSKEALQARQEAVGERRKYYGPTSEQTQENESTNKDNPPNVPQTDCKEPSGTQD